MSFCLLGPCSAQGPVSASGPPHSWNLQNRILSHCWPIYCYLEWRLLVNNAWKKISGTYGPNFSSMLVSASDWLKLIFEKVCGFTYIKITLSTNLDRYNRFHGSFCCDLPQQELNLVSSSGEMTTGWNSHLSFFWDFQTRLLLLLCLVTMPYWWNVVWSLQWSI